MIILDLKTVLLVAALLLLACSVAGIAIGRRTVKTTRLKDSASLYEHPEVFDHAPFGVMQFDAGARCLYTNACVRDLLSISALPAELPSDEWGRLLLHDLQTLPESSRTMNLSPAQAVHWWVRTDGNQTLVFLLDISAQRNIERTYHAFLSDLTHEMRSPLSAISAHLDVIATPDLPDASRDLSLDVVRRETARAVRLVRDLSELNRLEMTSDVAEHPVDLMLLVEEVVAGMILSAEERRIALSLRADSPLSRVLGDPDRLKQVFANLLDNAIKYCRPNDKVEIDLHASPGGVECAVRDTGPGIAAEHLPHLTERLYRVRTDVPGSGLGLALVEGILRRHHSHLQIESLVSGEHTGTVMRFLLPTVA